MGYLNFLPSGAGYGEIDWVKAAYMFQVWRRHVDPSSTSGFPAHLRTNIIMPDAMNAFHSATETGIWTDYTSNGMYVAWFHICTFPVDL